MVGELPGISRLSAAYLHKSIMDINIVHNHRMEPTFREFILIIHTYYQVIQFALPLHYDYWLGLDFGLSSVAVSYYFACKSNPLELFQQFSCLWVWQPIMHTDRQGRLKEGLEVHV